jgi:hypothetical protein
MHATAKPALMTMLRRYTFLIIAAFSLAVQLKDAATATQGLQTVPS